MIPVRNGPQKPLRTTLASKRDLEAACIELHLWATLLIRLAKGNTSVVILHIL